MFSPQQTSYFNQNQRVEHASNLFHSEYIEHLRVFNFLPHKNFLFFLIELFSKQGSSQGIF